MPKHILANTNIVVIAAEEGCAGDEKTKASSATLGQNFKSNIAACAVHGLASAAHQAQWQCRRVGLP